MSTRSLDDVYDYELIPEEGTCFDYKLTGMQLLVCYSYGH